MQDLKNLMRDLMIKRLKGESPTYETYRVEFKIHDHMKDDRVYSTVVHVTQGFTTVDDIPEMVALYTGQMVRRVEIVGKEKMDG